MQALAPSGPNAEQIQYWNEMAGPKWVAFQPLLDAQIRSLGERTMDRAAIAAGERVLDVGCGCGNTTLEIARRVGPSGAVMGLDISTLMLERAQQSVHAAGATHARLENADAQTHRFQPDGFDVLFSRFGVMFFTDPVAAFANLRVALRPGGRLAFVCWQALPQNPWMLVPLMAALTHIAPPVPPAPDAPGPFAFANPERVRDILSRAGFADPSFEAVTETLGIGDGDLDKAADFLVQMGPTGHALRTATAETRALVTGAVREALVPFATPEGVRLTGAAWIVTARRP